LSNAILLVVWIAQVVCVTPMTGAEVGFFESTAWVQVEDWRASIVHQARQLALGQRCGRRRGRGSACIGRRRVRRIRRRRLLLRQEAIVWRRLKPVLEKLVKEDVAVQASSVSGFRLPVQVVLVTPDYSPQDINLEQPTVLQVYREVRECCDERCQARIAPELDFVEKEGRFTKRAKQKAIASVTEDGMPLERVPQRMWRDFHVRTARFSGVVGIDEVHLHDEDGKKQYLVVAVDPINDRTIPFDLVDSRDGEAIKGFLEQLKAMGVDPLVVVTDMWKAYHSAIPDIFPEAEHQLCVFHVIQAMMKHTNKAMLAYRRELPKETDTQKAVRKELWDCRYLVLKANHKLSAQQRKRLEELLDTHQEKVRYQARKTRTRLNYVRIRARQRNQRSVERNDRLRRRRKRRAVFAGRADAVVEREARMLAA